MKPKAVRGLGEPSPRTSHRLPFGRLRTLGLGLALGRRGSGGFTGFFRRLGGFGGLFRGVGHVPYLLLRFQHDRGVELCDLDSQICALQDCKPNTCRHNVR